MKKYKLWLFLFLVFFSFLPINLAQNQNSTYQIIEVCDKGLYLKSKEIYFYSKDIIKLPSFGKERLEKWQQNDLSIDISAIDEKGNLWLLMAPEILCYCLSQKVWQILTLPMPVAQSHYGESFVSLEIWKGNLWMATNDILWCFYIKEKRWEPFSYPRNKTGNILKKGPENFLWMGGDAFFNGTTWTVLPSCPIPLSFWPITPHCYSRDKKNQPWLATVQGIYFYDNQYYCWRSVPGKNFSRAYSLVSFQGEIYCTNYGDGLYRFSKNQWEKILSPKLRPDLSCILALFSSSGTLWMNTYFGIGSFDGKKWVSHYDSTQYEKRNILFNFTLFFVILILFVGIISFLMLEGARKYGVYGKLFQENSSAKK